MVRNGLSEEVMSEERCEGEEQSVLRGGETHSKQKRRCVKARRRNEPGHVKNNPIV